MGTVYLAEDATIGQQVAIKIIRSDASDYQDLSSAMRALERFKHEARAVASLDHLHILPLYRYGEEETESGVRAYMVMQYRPEGSLWDWLHRRAGLATGQSLVSAPKLPAGLNTNWPLSLEEGESICARRHPPCSTRMNAALCTAILNRPIFCCVLNQATRSISCSQILA